MDKLSPQIAEVPHRRNTSKKKTFNNLVGLPVNKKNDARLSYEEFCDLYNFRSGNEPIVFETVTTYVKKKKIQNENWSIICKPYDLLLTYLGKEKSLLIRLIYGICADLLKSTSIKGISKRSQLKKIEVREANRVHKRYLEALIVVKDYIGNIAPYREYGNEKDPLSGYRLRELSWQLRALFRAELEIDSLKKIDGGRSAAYPYDDFLKRYKRIGTRITDPITVLLIYIWKAKEDITKSSLNEADFQAIAAIMEFLKFFPAEMQNNTIDQIIQLKERLKYYKKTTFLFDSRGMAQEYIPMAFIEKP